MQSISQKDPSASRETEMCEWERASPLEKWTFSVATPMINAGQLAPLQYDQLLHIAKRDHSSVMIHKLKRIYATCKPFWFIPRLMVALIRMSGYEVVWIAVYTVLEAAVMVASPLFIRFLLISLKDDKPDSECYMWAALLSILSFSQVFMHHVLFFMSMRTGWNWKNSSTALIHDKLISLDTTVLQSSGASTGMLVNLISNDVQRFEEFTVFAMSSWVSLLVVVVILVELVFILDVPSAFAGVGCMVLLIPVMIYFAKRFAKYRGQTAAGTDSRVRYISEVIDGIASVKSYAWETPFFKMISGLRQHETKFIAKSQVLRAVNQGLMFCTAAIVAFATFGVYWGAGGTFTVPQVFATIALLQVLRFTIGRAWTRSIETGSEAIASCKRIEAFLDLEPYPQQQHEQQQQEVGGGGGGGEEGLPLLPSDHIAAAAAAVEQIGVSIDDNDQGETRQQNSDSVPPILRIDRSSYCYGSENEMNPILRDISFSVGRGELLMVVGPVGSGKSSLLAAILGELRAIGANPNGTAQNSNTISNEGSSGGEKAATSSSSSGGGRYLASGTRIAYCAQRPWILAASVKSNIALAGKKGNENDDDSIQAASFKHPVNIDMELYASAVESCLIVEDLQQWPAYDDTEVGERGISVSGGQKARISLARAVYSDADLFVLDDPLSAVDAHVGKALMQRCILGVLKHQRQKAVVLVTHQLQNLEYADRILVLNSTGMQTFYGTFPELQAQPDILNSLDMTNLTPDSSQNTTPIPSRNVSGMLDTNTSAGTNNAPDGKQISAYDPMYRQKMRLAREKAEEKDNQEKRGSINNINSSDDNNNESQAEEKRRKIVQEEDRVEGVIGLGVYWKYICSGGALRGIAAVTIIFLSQGVLMMSEYWLRWWATEEFGDQGKDLYIIVFAALVVACVVVGFYRALGWFQFSLRAASTLHEKCLWAVMHSPMTFFVSNPTGRVLNRFSKDQNLVDEMLPSTFFSFLETLVYCLAAVALVCITIPWLCFLLPVLGYFFLFLRRKYVTASREIKRMEAVTRSPIYADFSATLEGLTTLRAYKLQDRVTHLFQHEIDTNARAWFSFILSARWLGSRLDLETAIILTFVCIFSVLLRRSVDVGLLGFTLVYTLALSGLFQWMVRQSAEVETQMTSVERISSYSELPPEEGYTSTLAQVLHKKESHRNISNSKSNNDSRDSDHIEHKQRGHLVLKDVSVKYRLDLDPVLKHISLDIPAGYKVGVCGRTGSGKSSTLLALLRLNIITAGDIVLDGQSLLQMDLQTSRGLLSIIPQDPHLFSGTIRFNLDPFSMHSDAELWAALKDAHIYEHIQQDPSGLGLSAPVEESGKNFSVGQRQLLSLARAILRNSKVVLMDEVTASIDYLTDRLIQETIRTSPALRTATIVTVAHRLRTIADSDLIVVVNAGEVVEVGPPGALLLQPQAQVSAAAAAAAGDSSGISGGGGLFKKLVEESNEFDEILRIATNSTK